MECPESADASSSLQKSRGRIPQLDMIHVFLLIVYLGVGEDRRQVSADMYFRDLNECVYFAQTLHKQGSQITAYCLPKLVDEGVRVY